jgi:glycosyl transferase family 61
VTETAPTFATVENSRWFAQSQCQIRFYCRGDAAAFRAAAERRIASIRILQGQPETLLEVDEAFWMPGLLCLYDKQGNRIDASCIRRGPGLTEYYKAGPETITVPKACAIIRKPLLYLSWVQAHWGHFLTEGVSRLWARSAYPELKKIRCLSCFPFPETATVAEYLAALGIASDQVRHFQVPVRVDKCFIPAASFANRAEAWSVHLRVSQEIVLAAADGDARGSPQQAVFLSRSRLGSERVTRRELELEQVLASRGVRIAHPEQLSLAEQIHLFNAHQTFIGCWGSAFHGLCLARAPERIRTHVIVNTVPNANYLMFDALLGCRSNYIQALHTTAGQPPDLPGSDFTIDVEAVLDYLHAVDCL